MIRRWDKSKPPRGPFVLNKDCIQAQGLQCWYPMGGVSGNATLADMSRTGQSPQTNTNTATFGIDVRNGQPVRTFVAASTQYFKGTLAATPAAPFSVMGWYKPASTGSQVIMSIHNPGSSQDAFTLYSASGTLNWFVRVAAGTNGSATGAVLTNGLWANCIAVETSATSRNCHTNGVAGTANTTSLAPANCTEIALGVFRASGVYSLYADGQIGESAMWNIALPVNVIKRLNDPGFRFEMWYPLRSKKWISMKAAAAGGVFTPYYYQEHVARPGGYA